MPSPFPGMDPYIEQREVWSDFHGGLAEAIRATLNQIVQPRYMARMTPYVTYDTIQVAAREDLREDTHSVLPDVGLYHTASDVAPTGMVATPIAPAPVESLIELEAPVRLYSVEIRTVQGLELVTSIEILSPVNKRRGHKAHRDFLRKRRELLNSEVHLLELDLLRAGIRPPLVTPVPDAPYYVTLSRKNKRPRVDVWPIQLADRLPVVPVPLLYPDPDVPLELGTLLNTVYERGAYAALIDYQAPPPPPPLSEAEQRWLDGWLVHAGKRAAR